MATVALQKLSDEFVKMVFDKYINSGNYMGFPMLYYGKLNFQVEAFPGAGQDYYTILRSVYKYAEESKIENFQEIFELSLIETVKKTFYPEQFSLFTNYLITELDNELKGISPFKIDYNKIYTELKHRVEEMEMLKDDARVKRDISKTSDYLDNYGK